MLNIINKNLFNKYPDGVLFDIDNTLYVYKTAHDKAKANLILKISKSLSIDIKEVSYIYDRARMDVKKKLKNTASSHNRLLYLQKMMEYFGLGSQIMLCLNFEKTYWRVFLENAKLFDGLINFLEELRIHKVPICTVTDLTTQIQFRKLVNFNLDYYFDFIVTSEETGADKPSKLPFLLALKKMNLKTKSNIWYIGDHPINDIMGAKKHINATTLHKLHNGVERSYGKFKADLEFNSYNDLLDLLKNIKKKV